MAAKDFSLSEDNDRGREEETHPKNPAPAANKPPPTTDVKNAHASGDGSFGRNDESLPEETAGASEKEDSAY